MNVGDVKTALKRYGFDDSDPLLVWINAAMQQVIDEHDWTWSRGISTGNTLLAGNNKFFLPTDAAATETVVVSDGVNVKKLTRKDYQTFVSMYDPNTTGFPEIYAPYSNQTGVIGSIGGGQIIMWPTADVTYTVDVSYAFRFDELVNDSDDLPIPVNLHYAVVLGAAYIALQAENEEERAGTAQAQFESRVSAAWIKDSQRGSGLDEPDQVEDVMNYGSSW